MPGSTAGSGSKKYGRNIRKPACQRYTHEQRWIKNKARKIAKQARLEAKQAQKKARRSRPS